MTDTAKMDGVLTADHDLPSKSEATVERTGGQKKRVLAAYSGVSMPMAAMGMPIAVYLPPFYAEGLGLDLVTVGLIFTLARIWDVVTDPLMGMAIDKYDSRWGRRKHWIALSIPILMISVWMVFLPGAENVSAVYLGFWLLALYVGYTMLAIAHQSWGAELATTYDERSRLFGWREIFVIGGMTAVLAIPAGVDLYGSGEHAAKVASMGLFCLILFPITVIPTLWMVPDSRHKTAMTIDWVEGIKVVLKNKAMWRLLIADLATGFGASFSGALYIFVAAYFFELPEHASLALLFYFLASFIAMPMWMKIAYYIGKDRTIMIALAYGVVVKAGLFLVAVPGSVAILWGYTLLYGIAYGCAPTLLRSMMADISDVDELHSGKKRAGLLFALLTTTNKLGAAVAVGVAFTFVETVVGFSPGTDNSEAAVNGLLATYCFGTAFGLAVAFFPLWRYPLDREEHERVREQLDQRAAQAG